MDRECNWCGKLTTEMGPGWAIKWCSNECALDEDRRDVAMVALDELELSAPKSEGYSGRDLLAKPVTHEWVDEESDLTVGTHAKTPGSPGAAGLLGKRRLRIRDQKWSSAQVGRMIAQAKAEELFPCAAPGCDVMRTELEGGSCFAVCDEHWTPWWKCDSEPICPTCKGRGTIETPYTDGLGQTIKRFTACGDCGPLGPGIRR